MRDGMPRAVLRMDGSAEIGLGHVMRCLALATTLVEDGWRVELLSAGLPAEITERAESHGAAVHEVVQVPGTEVDALELARLEPDLAIVDGYHFGREFFNALMGQGCVHVVVDDNGDTAAIAPAMIINQNPHAVTAMYDGMTTHPRLLLGLDFVLLREELRRLQVDASHDRDHPVVFVSLGGSDPCGLTLPIATQLARTGASIRVAIGAANPIGETLSARLRSVGVHVVHPRDFESDLSMADVAVVGAGSTMWEAAHLGVPSVGVIVAPNQVAPCVAAERIGFARGIEGRSPCVVPRVASMVEALLADDATRMTMSQLGRCAVDGSGVDRVVAALSGLAGSES